MSSALPRLVLLLALAGSHLQAQSLTITNATVIDVSTGALHRGTTIVVAGNRIASVEPSAATARWHGRVVDAKGMYVIPGLWDMHTHAYFGWSRDFGDRYVLPLFTANGITGIRDMGSDLDAVLRARADVAEHRLVGPRMVVSVTKKFPEMQKAIAGSMDTDPLGARQRVETGRIADLLIARANPLEAIANTRAIAGVVADGKYWSQAEIDRLRERVKRVAAAR